MRMMPQLATPPSDGTRAIFLIAFGSDAHESTLVERCVLSIRRRGAWDGLVVLLTDAPPGRYETKGGGNGDGNGDGNGNGNDNLTNSVLGGNVVIVTPQSSHYNHEAREDLVYKRFKTYILDYVDSDPRLDAVELVYYLDIDIMAGAPLDGLFRALENKYGAAHSHANTPTTGASSRIFFFKGKSWPVQGGQFLLERRTSQYCLDLWRAAIDGSVHRTTKDQDSLASVHKRIVDGEETECELVLMEKGRHLSFPRNERDMVNQVERGRYTPLIHLLNTYSARKIGAEAQAVYIDHVLELSEEEKALRLFGKEIMRIATK